MVDKLRNSEANDRRIIGVESAFGAHGQPLRLPGRVLVGEGVLVKMCRKKPKPRQFFLFNDILVYGNILISKRKYNKQNIVPLEDVLLEDLDDDGDYQGVMLPVQESKNGWVIKTRKKSFAVFAATATEKKEWMIHINRCIKELEKSGKKLATDHAAVWVPDDEAKKCMICNKTAFSVLVRRHHCRSCGAVACGTCTAKRVLIPSLSKRPVRVCDKCHCALEPDASTGAAHPAAGVSAAVSTGAAGQPKGSTADESSDDEDYSDEDADPSAVTGETGPPQFYASTSH